MTTTVTDFKPGDRVCIDSASLDVFKTSGTVVPSDGTYIHVLPDGETDPRATIPCGPSELTHMKHPFKVGDKVKWDGDRYTDTWVVECLTIMPVHSCLYIRNPVTRELKFVDSHDCAFAEPTNDEAAEAGTDFTVGQKFQKAEQLSCLDPQALLELGRVAGMGADKYERYNYLKGFDWHLAYDALQRHVHAFWSGEDIDPESECSHMAHAAWHALCLVSFAQRNLGTDDRPPR